MRVLDFFPLDGWVQAVSSYFEENLNELLDMMLRYFMPDSRLDSEVKQPNSKTGLRDPLMKSSDSGRSSSQSFKPNTV